MARNGSSFGYGTPTFTCRTCRRRTRDTGDNGNVELCPDCYELAGQQNGLWDNGSIDAWVMRDARARLASIEKKGGDVAQVKAHFKDLIAAVEAFKSEP